jgi:hypothetical protein
MNLHFKIYELLEPLSKEEIAKGIANNEITYCKLRNEIIKKEFNEIKATGKPVMDAYIDLSEKYFISESTVRDAVK